MNVQRDMPEPDGGITEPPPTRRESLVDRTGRHRFEDPYRWLEEDSPEVSAWARAQHAYTRQALSSLPFYRSIRARLETLLRGPRQGAVVQAADCFFHFVRQPDAERWSLRVSTSIDGPQRALVDPGAMFA